MADDPKLCVFCGKAVKSRLDSSCPECPTAERIWQEELLIIEERQMLNVRAVRDEKHKRIK